LCDECYDMPNDSKIIHEKGSLECLNIKIELIVSFILRSLKSIIQNNDKGKNHILSFYEKLGNQKQKISTKICEFEQNKH